MYTISGDIARWNTYTTQSGREYRFEIWHDVDAEAPDIYETGVFLLAPNHHNTWHVTAYRNVDTSGNAPISDHDLDRIGYGRAVNTGRGYVMESWEHRVLFRYITSVLRGVVTELRTEYETYVAYIPGDDIDRWWNGDRGAARESLESWCSSYRAWADGECYGVSFDDDRAFPCGGFIGYDHEKSGLMDTVREECEALAAEDDALDAEISSMIVSELGTVYA